MLVIDDNMFRLAKMQETLLKVSNSNRKENLNNYKKTVLEIDTRAFNDILEEIKRIDVHNQSLESELQFLEKIKKAYDQLLELQMSFKRVCELYDDEELKLSDLSRLNIEYIDSRINTITGYLTNLKNIEKNKEKLQQLNEQLVDEERKKVSLDNRLSEMETILRNNFLSAEGRFINDGKLQYASVISEYKELGFDFNKLLNDTNSLEETISEFERKRTEVQESVKAAEICYNSVLSLESKQVLNEINREFLLIKYKLTMLKIIKLLSHNCIEYDDIVRKREQLLDLINYRLGCMDNLGIKISIDPFGRTKVQEQLETILALKDNSKTINKLRKEISLLSSRTDEMLKENNGYLLSLSDTRSLIEDKVSFNDVDTTSIDFDFEDMLIKKEIAPNQVVSVREISSKLNMYIVGQKTASVIKRVNQMVNRNVSIKNETREELVPELVIVPGNIDEEKVDLQIVDDVDDYDEVLLVEDELEEEKELVIDLPLDEINEQDNEEEFLEIDTSDMFETVVPFAEPSLFMDRTDEELQEKIKNNSDSLTASELNNITNKKEDNLEFTYTEDQMPDAFWVTQNEEDTSDDYVIPSFDEQVQMLLDSENVKTKRKVA